MPRPIALLVNGRTVHVAVDRHVPLLYVLRNDLSLNGPKYGCGLGECGACTVLLDDAAARSCAVPVGGVAGRSITTLEGLAQAAGSRAVDAGAPGGPHDDILHPVQRAYRDTQAAQCGYCLNGMVMATVALLRRTPQPSDAQARAALQHHLCRCGTHIEILAAVRRAAQLMASTDASPVTPADAALE